MIAMPAPPLAGRRVLVTRAAEQSESLVELLGDAGADVLQLPTLSIVPLDVGNALQDVPHYEWIVFTSPNGVRAIRPAVRSGWPAVAVVGRSTAEAAAQAGLNVVFRPGEPRGALLGEELPLAPGARVLLIRSDIARPELPAALRRRGAIVDEVVAYRTVPRSEPSPETARALTGGRVDAIVLTSPSGARGLVAACGGDSSLCAGARIVAIGPTTAAAAAELGLAVAAQAVEPSDRGLLDALAGLWRTE